MSKQAIVPMQTSGIEHLIERTYREGGRYQWVRETAINALEAKATRVEFGVAWPFVEEHGVYRRTIMDDGTGMDAEQLTGFFNTLGAGGKKIGGLHENFGVGAKTSLLPWNPEGVVVLSWVGGEGSMIWMRQDKTGAYGLKLFEAKDDAGETTLETVVEPFGPWAKLKPDWIKDHGTVIVLLGKDPKQNTILGDPGREENDLKGIAAYLNRRLWEIPAGAAEIIVEETRSSDRNVWPRTAAEAYGPEPQKGADRRINRRTVLGARHYIRYHENFKKGKLGAEGTVPLKDGTRIDWFLWEGERPGVQSYAAFLGYVGTLYRNELYDVTTHLAVYRSFGVTAPEVRSRLWLVIVPPETAEDKMGVYPRTDRNGLLVHGAGHVGEPLPIHNWAAEFADQMPEEIREALAKARNQESNEVDDAWKERMAERFGTRWKIEKFRVTSDKKDADTTVSPAQVGSTPAETVVRSKKKRHRAENEATTGTRGDLVLGTSAGDQPAQRTRVKGGIPTYRIVSSGEVEPGMLAAWLPHDPVHPEGVVMINGDHPVIRGQIKYWTGQYPDHMTPEVERDVLNVYGQLAVAKVAHSEQLRGVIPSDVIEQQFRSEAALTMSLLGLVAEEHVIAARLGAKYGKRKGPTASVPMSRVSSWEGRQTAQA